MSPTVHELRNQIRTKTGRFTREVNAQFTKEELDAIAGEVGHDGGDRRPSKGAMRAAIRQRIEIPGGDDRVDPFTKDELVTLADALSEE